MKPTLVALVGKSATGKTFWADHLYNSFDFPGTRDKLISYTTRPPRVNELNGKDYYFVSWSEFEDMKNNNEFLETTYYKGWYYGHKKYTSHADYVIGIFDPAGIKNVVHNHRKDFSDIIVVYLEAGLFTRLHRMYEREGRWQKEYFRRIFVDAKSFYHLIDDLVKQNCWVIPVNTKSSISHNIYYIQDKCKYIHMRRVEKDRLNGINIG